MNHRLFITGFTLLLASQTAWGGNIQFLNHSVTSELSRDEVASFKQRIAEALNEAPDLRTINWQSSSSNLRGRVKIKYSYLNDGAECRNAIVDLRNDEDRRDFYHADVCKQGNKWVISQTAASEFSREDWNSLNSTLTETLNNNSDREAGHWQYNGHKATLTPVNSFTDDQGNQCRLTSVELTDKSGAHSRGDFSFCKQGNEWQRAEKLQ
ncbi:hypothetical protein [Gilvimarinus agarilyticus]|uniref:hypothetical protein n=1 Tax=Gilvimarinus agarilyticus TaxID=679259 RepID=UPI0005A14B3D|nr:hypothetical protein [Gilvimarinus agarilyticus]